MLAVCLYCRYWSKAERQEVRCHLATVLWLQRHCKMACCYILGRCVCLSPSFSAHLEESSAPIISTEIAHLYFEANPLPFHPLCNQRKKGQMLFTLTDLAVIYIYPVLYTASSQSPSCHHSKQVFFLCCADEENGDDRDSPRQ